MQPQQPMATDLHVVNDPDIFTLRSPTPNDFRDKDSIVANEIDQPTANKFFNA